MGVLLCRTPCFITYENTTKSTEPKWLGLIAVQSWRILKQKHRETVNLLFNTASYAFFFLEDPVKIWLFKKPLSFLVLEQKQPTKIIHGCLVYTGILKKQAENCPISPDSFTWSRETRIPESLWLGKNDDGWGPVGWFFFCTNCITRFPLLV